MIVVESPAKAKTIGKFLGRKYTVKASMGHVRDLPRSQLGVDVEHNFTPKYITIRGKGELLKELREQAKKADRVMLASDPDREGEAIAWHLVNLLGVDEQSPCRIEFHEITKEAITQAVKHPRAIDIARVNAQQARRVLDRLVGYSLSPLLWRKVRKGLSAGRVQSVAVRLICDREEEIRNFKPEEYWSLTARLREGKNKGKIFSAKLFGTVEGKLDIKNAGQMDSILKELAGREYRVEKIKRSERKKNPPLPFTTSNLQQEASRKLGFSVKKTMLIAQQLYEGLELGKEGSVGLVTYIRTDSTRIAETAQKDARDYIARKFSMDFLPAVPRQTKAKQGAQDAHEAIRPTSIFREPESVKEFLNRDQFRLYQLIWERFVASQMSPAVFDTLSVDIAAGNYVFRATGSTLKFPGFMQVYIEGQDEETEKEEQLPDLVEGQQLYLQKLEPNQHFTQPPPRYTEAMLVKTLEEKGIGRPSTYAPIIDTIQARGYVAKEDKRLFPTELGEVVNNLLKQYFPNIVNVQFTAEMEDRLDQVEEGQADWVKVVQEFYDPFKQDLAHAEGEIGEITIQEEVSDEKCELCGRNMVIKHGRFGPFLACPGFPECRHTRPLLKTVEGVTCPVCGGEIVERKSKRGRKFYGCKNYPNCQFTTWYEPVAGKTCPICGAFLVKQKTKTGEVLKCSREGCTYPNSL